MGEVLLIMPHLVIHNLEVVNLLPVVKRNLPLEVIVARVGDHQHILRDTKDPGLLRLSVARHLFTLLGCNKG